MFNTEGVLMKYVKQIILLFGFLSLVFLLNGTYTYCHDDCILGCKYIGLNEKIGFCEYCSVVFLKNCFTSYRYIVQSLGAFFSGAYFDKWIFDVCNTIMMCLLILLINKRSTGCWFSSFRTFALSCALVWFLLCKGESYLWCAGSCNYLWAGVVSLVFLLLRDRLEYGSIGRIGLMIFVLYAMFAGAWQESFCLPICFALVFYGICGMRQFNLSKAIVYGAYAIGAAFAVMVSVRRIEGHDMFSVFGVLKEGAKCLWSAKAFWIVILLFLATHCKREFIRRNLFEVLIIFASLGMLSVCGYNGERAIWIASICSIIVILREWTPNTRVVITVVIAMFAVMIISFRYGCLVKMNFDKFRDSIRHSVDGVACHQRVDCGLFERYLFQDVFQWSEREQDCCGAVYYGGREHMVVLSKELYDDLYVCDNI